MYRLLIIDDEVTVVDRLAFGIDWESIGVLEVYKAYNVEMAYEILEKMRIDIILTDIKMPKGTGLDIAKRVSEIWKHSKVILLSGYEDFEYAKNAIEYGVVKYLIKPATYDELIATVKQAIDMIEKQLSEEAKHDLAKKRLENAAPMISGRYMYNWIVKNNPMPNSDDLQFLKEYTNFSLEEESFLILIHIDNWIKDGNTAEQAGFIDVMLLELVKKILISDTNIIMFRDDYDNYILIGQHEEGNNKAALHYIMEMAQTFQSAIKHSLNCITSIYFDKETKPDDIPKSYRRILHTMYLEPKLNTGVIMGPGNIVDENKKVEKAFKFSNRYTSLPMNINSLKKEEALKDVELLFDELIESENTTNSNLQEIYLLVVSSIMKSSHEKNTAIAEWFDDKELLLEKFSSINELKKWCIDSISKFIDFFLLSDNKNNRIIQDAKKMIDENIEKEISLSVIADKLYIHPNYLSTLFKREGRCSFSEYLTNQRISLAKRLLLEHGIKVYEVAERVGYSSVAHFTRTFKKVMGISPKEYQTQM